ncbi:hypothetical protein GFC01_09025 [Desulfofundulus thermobenzoicus]|uniref:Uncharacterized protein n=1 Tax=Desulfofundulus thermobenzoicus TaxID=29376 RepID=A0A6N7IS73_9FIRM|nr:hypothetical protein [Desulfofundulus thermobenzoicus]MQL52403.1 hypothetical protein [Desulfofundulus thermobenzoicus]HHW43002.1 hypothetical protein [Desulfotomaculum sp.]
MAVNKRVAGPEVNPQVVAAITAALAAAGYLTEGSRITGIRPSKQINAWKLAGIRELMNGREISSF